MRFSCPRLVGAVVLTGAVLMALAGCGPRWHVVLRLTIPPCQADRPSPSACPAARSDPFAVASGPWRVTGERAAMGSVGAWWADAVERLRESKTEPRDATLSYYFDVPGRFFIFNSSDQAVRVVIEEYR